MASGVIQWLDRLFDDVTTRTRPGITWTTTARQAPLTAHVRPADRPMMPFPMGGDVPASGRRPLTPAHDTGLMQHSVSPQEGSDPARSPPILRGQRSAVRIRVRVRVAGRVATEAAVGRMCGSISATDPHMRDLATHPTRPVWGQYRWSHTRCREDQRLRTLRALRAGRAGPQCWAGTRRKGGRARGTRAHGAYPFDLHDAGMEASEMVGVLCVEVVTRNKRVDVRAMAMTSSWRRSTGNKAMTCPVHRAQ